MSCTGGRNAAVQAVRSCAFTHPCAVAIGSHVALQPALVICHLMDAPECMVLGNQGIVPETRFACWIP